MAGHGASEGPVRGGCQERSSTARHPHATVMHVETWQPTTDSPPPGRGERRDAPRTSRPEHLRVSSQQVAQSGQPSAVRPEPFADSLAEGAARLRPAAMGHEVTFYRRYVASSSTKCRAKKSQLGKMMASPETAAVSYIQGTPRGTTDDGCRGDARAKATRTAAPRVLPRDAVAALEIRHDQRVRSDRREYGRSHNAGARPKDMRRLRGLPPHNACRPALARLTRAPRPPEARGTTRPPPSR